MKSGIGIGGVFALECRDKHGALRWTARAKNAVTNQGLNHALDVVCHGATQKATWYIGFIDAAGYTALAAADTAASHAGWSEATPYEGNRPAWTEDAASGQSMTNSSAVAFTINATKTLKGAFLSSVNTGGGAGDVLLCTALFTGGDRAVQSGDTVNVTYTLTASAT